MITGHRWETDASERGEGFCVCLNVSDPGRCAFDPNDAMVASQPLPHVRTCAALDASCRELADTSGREGSWRRGGVCKVDVRLERGLTGFCCVSLQPRKPSRI